MRLERLFQFSINEGGTINTTIIKGSYLMDVQNGTVIYSADETPLIVAFVPSNVAVFCRDDVHNPISKS